MRFHEVVALYSERNTRGIRNSHYYSAHSKHIQTQIHGNIVQCQWNTASNPIFSGLIPFLWTIFYIFQLNIVYLKVPNAIITGYCVGSVQSLATPNEQFTQRRIELTSGLCSLNGNSITKSFERFNWHAQSWKWQIFKRFCHFLELQRLLQDFWLFRIILHVYPLSHG